MIFKVMRDINLIQLEAKPDSIHVEPYLRNVFMNMSPVNSSDSSPWKSNETDWLLEIEVSFTLPKGNFDSRGEICFWITETGEGKCYYLDSFQNLTRQDSKTSPSSTEYIFSVKNFKVVSPNLWFPVNFIESYEYYQSSLYTLNVAFYFNSSQLLSAESFSSKKSLASSFWNRKIGFRHVSINQPMSSQGENLTTDGNLFFFKINNAPIVFRGANFIPLKAFEDDANRDDNLLKWIIRSSKESGMVPLFSQ